MNKFLEKIFSFLEKLTEKTPVGGLQISDSFLQLFLFSKTEPKIFTFKMPPGVIVNGRVVEKETFLKLLKNLHRLVYPQKEERRLNVVVCLPNELVYAQSFTVPYLEEEKLEESALLNLRMVSPLPLERAYFSWQDISKTEENYEFFGAVIEKEIVEEYRLLLAQANFLAIVFEFPALALMRAIYHLNQFSFTAPILFIHLSSDGLNFFISKNHSLTFDYFRSWRSIQGEKREITKSDFEKVILEETKRVIDFVAGRFHQNLKQVVLMLPVFENEIKEILEKNFDLVINPLILKEKNISLNNLVSWGSALRGQIDRFKDREINFSSISSVEEYYQEKTLRMIEFWRNLSAGVLLIFLIVFITVAVFLVNVSNQLEEEKQGFSFQSQEIEKLSEKAKEFNGLIEKFKAVQKQNPFWLEILNRFKYLASNYQIIIDNLNIRSRSEPILISGRALSSEGVLNFKKALENDKDVALVDLPLSAISEMSDKTVRFNLTITLKPL